MYNRPDTQYFRAAQKIKSHAEKIFVELDHLKVPHPEVPAPDTEADGVEMSAPRLVLGDLEPPLETVRLLSSQSAIADQIDMELDTDPISALFSYELPRPKPSAAAEQPEVSPPAKAKRDRRADRDRARLTRLVLDAAAGFRARTRSSIAAENSPILPSPADDAMDVDADEQVDDGMEPGVDRKKGKKPKRPPVLLPGQAEVPPVVDEVDNQKMFSMFDGGWILPEGHKRFGRTTLDRQPLDLKKKKVKMGALCSVSGVGGWLIL